MELSKDTHLMALAVSPTSYQDLLDEQKDLLQNQIEKLQEIIAAQCKLTGVNPLSQEMAAGALSIKIGKKPRDLLNPKAVKYMQLVFSMKEAISKRETREISAQFGVTITQIVDPEMEPLMVHEGLMYEVRDFFTGQRSRVRKFIRLSREKANRSSVCDLMHDGIPSTPDPFMTVEPIPLDTIPPPTNSDEGSSCTKRHEGLSGLSDSDLHFVENIFTFLRKEESFSGQVKLLRWILRIKNPSVLNWFLIEGGLMILATWLCEAAKEEQTSFLLVGLKLLDYLPVSKALPVHMSAILQSVNSLRFYRASDISHRARILLSKWIGKKLSSKKINGMKSASEIQDEMLLEQSISEVMGNESWDLNDGNTEQALKFLCNNPNYSRKPDVAQPLKMLTASEDDSNKRKGVLPSHGRERRKVQMVEHPSQRLAVRSPQVARSTSATQSRPLSADDIQKAKMRAQFMHSKHGKTVTCSEEKIKPEIENKCAASVISFPPLVSKSNDRNEHEEKRKLDDSFSKTDSPSEPSPVNLEEPPWKKCKRIQISWRTPPEVKINEAWSVGNGASSKEVEVQRNRIRREREVTYRTIQETPSDPREPWDREMDCDDSLTPKIPIEQLPDDEPLETPPVAPNLTNGIVAPAASTSSESIPAPDFELLAELLKNPELVFALTSGKDGNLSSDETVKLLDMIKANGVSSLSNLAGNANSRVEVSLPSPTPSSDPVPNGLKPDFSRNPFSRQHGLAAGAAYPIQQQGIVQSPFPAATMLTPQPSTTARQFGDVVVPPVPSLQTSLQLPEQWPAHTNPLMHHQSSRHNSSNIQHLTTEKMLNPNTVANFNRASSNTFIASSPTNWADSIGNAKPMPSSRSVTPPRPFYLQESTVSNSMRARQSLESNYPYQNNRTRNNYNAYARGSVGDRGGRNNHAELPEFESWSPDNTPSRGREYLPGRSHNGPHVNLRDGYRHSGFRDAGNKRWQNHRR